jgi:hypothetical protein
MKSRVGKERQKVRKSAEKRKKQHKIMIKTHTKIHTT